MVRKGRESRLFYVSTIAENRVEEMVNKLIQYSYYS